MQTVLWRFGRGSPALGRVTVGRGRAEMTSKAGGVVPSKAWCREWSFGWNSMWSGRLQKKVEGGGP